MVGAHRQGAVEHLKGLLEVVDAQIGRTGIVGPVRGIERGGRAERDLVDALIEEVEVAEEQAVHHTFGRQFDVERGQ